MSKNTKILIVSAGMDSPKKRDHVLSRRQQYLNYGALSLATVLSTKGYDVTLVHGEHTPPKEFFERIISVNQIEALSPLLLSIPSFYSLSWAQEFTRIIKFYNRNIEIVVGGRWVVGSDVKWLKEHLIFADRIVPGLAEDKIEGIINGSGSFDYLPWGTARSPLFNLDHKLIYGFRNYQPSIEASRGCGMRCAFCEERDIPLTPLKKPELLVDHFKDIIGQYQDTTIRPYVQSSFFAPNVGWSEALAKEVIKSGVQLSWRCETRVDSVNPDAIASLAAAGLKVIDLGLESAAPAQILRMKKSRHPDKYLRSASELINSCKKNGIWVKLNFLIYAGETLRTFDETIRWLDEHSESFKGISVGPVIVFGSPRTASGFIASVIEAGGSLVEQDSNERIGIGHINPSGEISWKDAERLSLDTSRRYMTDIDYFDLKSFSYYPRNYTHIDFKNDIIKSDKERLPFRLTTVSG